MRVLRLAAAAISAIALALIPTGTAHASWTTSNQHQTVPVYAYPSWWDANSFWRDVLDNSNATNIGSTVIANLGVNSQGVSGGGPGTSYNSDLATTLGYAHDKGHNAVGYVDTNYGQRSLADVKADIDAWYSRYTQSPASVTDLTATGSIFPDNAESPDSRIDGIFLDQVLLNAADTAPAGSGATANAAGYYRDIYLYVKNGSHGDFDDVRANPGQTPSTDWMLHDYGTATQIADEVMVFEGPKSSTNNNPPNFDNYAMPSWMSSYPASDFDFLVHATASSDIAAVCTKSKTVRAGSAYITDQAMPNPWSVSPGDTYYASIRSNCG